MAPSVVLVLTPLTLSTRVDRVEVDEARVLPLVLVESVGNLSRGSNLAPGDRGCCDGISVFRNRYRSGVGRATLIDDERLRLNIGDFWCCR